ncbi:MAG: hypothetical protein V9E90_00145 [Saprospiraceae bacterium]
MQNSKMVAVLTGDVINSRKGDTASWMPILKRTLAYFGKDPKDWEIYRGDSFQMTLPVINALDAAFLIKASLKQIPKLDVRIAIGIGTIDYQAAKITESSGDAFTRSGACFDALKKQTMGIATGDEDFNEKFNLMLTLGLLTMDSWSSIVAKAIQTALENPDKNQLEVAQILRKSQSSVSEALTRGGYEELLRLINYFKHQIHKL